MPRVSRCGSLPDASTLFGHLPIAQIISTKMRGTVWCEREREEVKGTAVGQEADGGGRDKF